MTKVPILICVSEVIDWYSSHLMCCNYWWPTHTQWGPLKSTLSFVKFGFSHWGPTLVVLVIHGLKQRQLHDNIVKQPISYRNKIPNLCSNVQYCGEISILYFYCVILYCMSLSNWPRIENAFSDFNIFLRKNWCKSRKNF